MSTSIVTRRGAGSLLILATALIGPADTFSDMEKDIGYGKEKYGLAFDLLEQVDLTLLAGRSNTPQNRLLAAVMEVMPCGAENFERTEDFAEHEAIRASLRDGDRKITESIPAMALEPCLVAIRRIIALAHRIHAA